MRLIVMKGASNLVLSAVVDSSWTFLDFGFGSSAYFDVWIE